MTAVSADRRSSNPQDDLFGYAPFAKSLANIICRFLGNDGLMLVLFSPRGFSGQENLARDFLGKLQAVLLVKNVSFKNMGNLLWGLSACGRWLGQL